MPAAARVIICSGSCNGEYRRAAAAYGRAIAEHEAAMARWLGGPRTAPSPPRPVPLGVIATPGDPVWCGRDTTLIRRSLAELDYLAARVAREAEDLKAPQADSGRVSGSRGTRTPSDLLGMVDEMERILRDWEHTVRGRDTPARRGFLARAVTEHVDWLLLNFDRAITHPDFGQDFGAEIRDWHRKMTSAGRAGTVRHTKPRPCTRCHRMSLVWTEGDGHVECQTPDCGRLMSLDEYDSYASVYPYLADAEGVA